MASWPELIALAVAAGAGWYLYRLYLERNFEEIWEDEAGNIYASEDALLPVEAAPPPARRAKVDVVSLEEKRESVRHGHIILDWLKNIRVTDKSIEELVDTGTPQEKQEVKALKEAVDSASQYLARALLTEPSLANNEKIREAQQAVQVLDHSIKLLAALEKPVSISQGMQISSDISQMPPHLDQAAKQGLGKLMERLAGGMAEANQGLQQAVEQQQEDQQRQSQEEDMAEQAMDSALHDPRKRRRRRRKQQRSSVSTSAKKISKDIRADDYALGQGAFAGRGRAVQTSPLVPMSERQQQAQRQQVQEPALNPMGALNAQQLADVRNLGAALAQNANAASNTSVAEQAAQAASGLGGKAVSGGSDVSFNDKLTPDEQALSAQEQLKREREQRREQRRQNRDQTGGGGMR